MIDEPGKKRRDLEKGDRAKGFHLGKRRAAGTTSARDADDRTMRPTTADTLVAHEVEDKDGVAAADSGPGDTAASGSARSSSLSRLPPQNPGFLLSRRIIQPPDPTTVNLNLDTDHHHYDDYDSDHDNEIVEVVRGREGHLGMSANKLRPAFRRTILGPVGRIATEMSRGPTPPPSTTTTTTIFPRSSSILPPIFLSPNIPLSYSPHNLLVLVLALTLDHGRLLLRFR
jgi:hypothetical protein